MGFLPMRKFVVTVCLFLSLTTTFYAETTTQPSSAGWIASFDRGEKVRRVLLDALEEAYAHEGKWPDQLLAVNSLVYSPPRPQAKPKDLSDEVWLHRQSAATVVLHESFERNPDGVWVGYADGHLEFAQTPADLSACKDQLSIAKPENSAGTTQPVAKGSLTLKLIDPDGKPVQGALVGVWGMFGDGPKIFGNYPKPPTFTLDNQKTATSDANGLLTVDAKDVFAEKFERQPIVPLYMLQEQRALVAEIDLSRGDFGAKDPREVRLQPACRVTCDVSSLGLREVNRPIERTLVLLSQPGRSRMYSVQCFATGTHTEFLLPAGEYHLQVYGNDTDYVYHHFRIAKDQRAIKFFFDIPPTAIASLYGKPAPELQKIKAWKNGGPVTLGQLRGKVVILDFWGYWCGSCVASMPALMKLHDRYKDKGLVIVAVHDDSAASIAEMDDKLSDARKNTWGGRDLPFLVALDGGGRTRIKYTATIEDGATTAAYGINRYPTTVLIDKQGKVVEEFSADDAKDVALLEKLLNEKSP
jgi:thiol-disulfide isomerase/thioredoxin